VMVAGSSGFVVRSRREEAKRVSGAFISGCKTPPINPSFYASIATPQLTPKRKAKPARPAGIVHALDTLVRVWSLSPHVASSEAYIVFPLDAYQTIKTRIFTS